MKDIIQGYDKLIAGYDNLIDKCDEVLVGAKVFFILLFSIEIIAIIVLLIIKE